jgi:branched-chain amino acid transport system substrate-binding protein
VRIARLVPVAAAFALATAACSGDDGDEQAARSTAAATTDAREATSATTITVVEPTVGSATSTTVVTAANAVDVALTYVGAADSAPAVTGGAAEPIVIGYVNEQGGTPSFPEATIGADAAVDYVNAVLGGVRGQPVALHPCFVVNPGDGERCAAELLADDRVDVVLTGTISRETLSRPLLAALRGRKPVVVANPLTTAELVADDAYAFTPGPPGIIQGMSIFAGRFLPGGPPRLVVVAHADSASGRSAYTALAKPALDTLGVPSVGVGIPAGASGADVASAVAAANASAAGAVIVLTPMAGCIAVHDGLVALRSRAAVVATDLCRGPAMSRHLAGQGGGESPDGWYFGGTGYSYRIPGNAELDAYVRAIGAYADRQGVSGLDPAGFAGPTYGNMLTIVRLMNDLGAADVTPDAMRVAARAFRGPMWGVVGPMACGANRAFPALCGFQVGIQQFSGGRWVSVRDGANGRPIDPRLELATG